MHHQTRLVSFMRKINSKFYIFISIAVISTVSVVLFLNNKDGNYYKIVFYTDCEDEEAKVDILYYSESIYEIENSNNIYIEIEENINRCGVEIYGDSLIYSTDGVVTDIDIIEIMNNYNRDIDR
jgi:low affinity Fe/Cu permease